MLDLHSSTRKKLQKNYNTAACVNKQLFAIHVNVDANATSALC